MLSRVEPTRRRRSGVDIPRGLILVTQKLDARDPVLGFVSGTLSAFAERCDRFAVIANEVRDPPRDDIEVISLGKERGAGQMQRGWTYQRTLVRLARTGHFQGVFAHMCPVYASLAAPVVRPLGLRVVLWFAHPRDSKALGLAERLSNVVVTSVPGAYPRKSRKVRAIGQAVDPARWSIDPRPANGERLELLAFGRTSPVKGYPVLIHAVADARRRGLPVRLRILGSATTHEEEAHRKELSSLIDRLGIGRAVSLEQGIPPAEVPNAVAGADIVLNATAGGSGDKTVFEAMAAGRPVLVSNPALVDELSGLAVSLVYPEGDATALADRLEELAGLDVAAAHSLGQSLRRRVIANHSLDAWSEAVVEVTTGIAH